MADITWAIGDKLEFESGVTLFCQVAEIDTDKYVVVYQDGGDGNACKARIATVSGTTITWGAISEFVGNGGGLGVCKLGTDKFVVVFRDVADSNKGYARVGGVSTRTITWGTAAEFEAGFTVEIRTCQLETNKFAVVYNDVTGGNVGTVVICTVDNIPSTNSIHPGTPVVFEGTIDFTSCAKLDTDKFVAVYRDTADSDKIKACAFSVSGTVPTPGAIADIDTNSAFIADCVQLDTDVFVVAWQKNSTTAGEVRICTVSTLTITPRTEATFSTDNISWPGIAKVDITHFVITFTDYGNSAKGTSVFCSVSGTTITPGSKELFNDAATLYTDVCIISSGKAVVVYRDDADVNDIGEAVIGEFSVVVGWAGGDVLGVDIGTVAKINGVALADITRVNGVA